MPRRTVRPAAFLLLAASGCAPWYVSTARQCGTPENTHTQFACSSSFEQFRRANPADAVAAYRAYATRLRADCDAARHGDQLYPPREGVAACFILATIHAGAETRDNWSRHLLALDRAAGSPIGTDWRRAVELLEFNCAATGGDRFACLMVGDVALASTPPASRNAAAIPSYRSWCERGNRRGNETVEQCAVSQSRRDDARWLSPTVRVTAIRALLASANATPASQADARRQLLVQAVALATVDVGTPDLVALRTEASSLLGASPTGDVEALFAGLDRYLAAQHTREGALEEFARVAAALRSLPPDALARWTSRLRAAVDRELNPAVEAAVALQHFAEAIACLTAFGRAGLAPESAERVAAIRAAARAFHERAAVEHARSGRAAAAALHLALARDHGGTADPRPARAAIRASLRVPPIAYEIERPEACPWVPAIAPRAAPPGSAEVTVRWDHCRETVREWTAIETHTTREATTATTTDMSLSASTTICEGGHCRLVSTGGGGVSTSRTTTGVESVTRTGEVPHQERAANAVVVMAIRYGGRVASVPVSVGTRPIAAREHERPAPIDFEPAMRVRIGSMVRENLLRALGPTGQVADAIANLEAQRMAEEASALVGRDAAGAEDAYARSLAWSRGETPWRATDYFRNRYGLTPEAIAAVFNPRQGSSP